MRQEPEKCISLPELGCWEVAEGNVDSVQFIKLLFGVFPEATSVFFEGTSIEDEVKELFEKYVEKGSYLPDSQVIWPKSECFRCCFSKELLSELSELAKNHAEPELFDHLFVYKNNIPLMEWPDAFANCIWISTEIPEKQVKEFTNKLALSFQYVQDG